MRLLTIQLAIWLIILSNCGTEQPSDNFSSGFSPDLVDEVELQPFSKHVQRLMRKLDLPSVIGSPNPVIP